MMNVLKNDIELFLFLTKDERIIVGNSHVVSHVTNTQQYK